MPATSTMTKASGRDVDAENLGQEQEDQQRDEGRQHEHVAMGEIHHADDAEDHRVADGDEPVDRTERQPVDQLLQEIVHAPPLSPVLRHGPQDRPCRQAKRPPEVPFFLQDPDPLGPGFQSSNFRAKVVEPRAFAILQKSAAPIGSSAPRPKFRQCGQQPTMKAIACLRIFDNIDFETDPAIGARYSAPSQSTSPEGSGCIGAAAL